jgi:hypothetical protein
MKSLQTDTLLYQIQTRPWTQPQNYAAVYLTDTVSAIVDFLTTDKLSHYSGLDTKEPAMGNPEQDALVFYTLNHAVSVIQSKVHSLEPLGIYLPILEEYNTQLSMRLIRMFYYMLIICTRESRHEKTAKSSIFWKLNKYKFGVEITDFCLNLRGDSSTTAVNKFTIKPPSATLGMYTAFLAHVFRDGDYCGGYGGKAWADVADVLNNYVHGNISAEIMLDTAFTLCHNNGPIFNKGVLFEGYSDYIYKILDVQRSGQIPQLLNEEGYKLGKFPEATRVFTKCSMVMGGDFNKEVDWFKVEELGSLKKYPNEKVAQKNKMPKNDNNLNFDKSLFDLKSKVIEVKVDLAPVDNGDKIVTIMPGLTVTAKLRKSK